VRRTSDRRAGAVLPTGRDASVGRSLRIAVVVVVAITREKVEQKSFIHQSAGGVTIVVVVVYARTATGLLLPLLFPRAKRTGAAVVPFGRRTRVSGSGGGSDDSRRGGGTGETTLRNGESAGDDGAEEESGDELEGDHVEN